MFPSSLQVLGSLFGSQLRGRPSLPSLWSFTYISTAYYSAKVSRGPLHQFLELLLCEVPSISYCVLRTLIVLAAKL